MAILEYNLQDLFQSQFGYQPAEFNIQDPDGGRNTAIIAPTGDLQTKELVNQDTDAGNYGSYYGKDTLGRTIFMPVTLGDLLLPYSWLSIQGTKRIVETTLTERRGSVKEYIAIDDYIINLKGFAIGMGGKFPESEIEAIKTLFERGSALTIKSILTDIFLLTGEHGGQDKVVITDLNIPENPGVQNVRGYEMTLITDQYFELEIE